MLSIATLTRDAAKSDPSTGRAGRRSMMFPAVAGAIAPDAAMFLFYAFEKLVLGSSERDIWTTRYFMPAWQDFFDLFNSVPIVLMLLLAAVSAPKVFNTSNRAANRFAPWVVFFASMLLHFACDLPVHHDDGHRHFWPLSDWRFESPVSYWDPKHFGLYAATAELCLFVGCYAFAMRKHHGLATRIAITMLAAVHLAMMALMFRFLTR